MAGSTLDPDNLPGKRRSRKNLKGHDSRSLGPSDSSDTGSDMAGPGLLDSDAVKLDRGTTEDIEAGHSSTRDAGASVGDLNLDDNTDKRGTGEHLTAGKEPSVRVNQDRDADRVVGGEEAGLGGGLDQAEEARRGKTDEEIQKEARQSKRR
jgi:hypothetical protein